MFEEERASRKELVELEVKRLRGLLTLAYERTPLYRRKFREAGVTPDEIRGLEDLGRLPFSSKEDLVQAPMGGVASKVAVWHSTSGTSGEPTLVGFSSEDVETQSLLEARNLRAVGVGEGDVVLNTVPYGMFFAGLCLHQGARLLGATVIPAGKLPSAKQHVETVRRLKPTVIIGIPQFLLRLAYVYEETFGTDPRKSSLKRAYALGEPVPEEVRRRIEGVWGVEVRLGYGLTEAGSGAECEMKNGVHWPEDHALVEVVDPERGERMGVGEEGELVYTALTRTGTLAVRFRSRDPSKVLVGGCGCGRTLVKILPPQFRLDGLVKVRGVLLSPYALEGVLFKHPEVRNYLCVVEKDREGVMDRLKLYVEADRQDPGVLEELKDRLGGVTTLRPDLVKYVPLGSVPSVGRKGVRLIDLRSPSPHSAEIRNFMERFR